MPPTTSVRVDGRDARNVGAAGAAGAAGVGSNGLMEKAFFQGNSAHEPLLHSGR
jgi:hypothetical protein